MSYADIWKKVLGSSVSANPEKGECLSCLRVSVVGVE